MDQERNKPLFARFGAASIKSKLTIFALLATLVPSVLLGYLFYTNNRAVLEEKISQSLDITGRNQSSELSRWLVERGSELRVFAASYVVGENLQAAIGGDEHARLKIENYLLSVSSRLGDLDAMAVTDLTGNVVASSSQGEWEVPGIWSTLISRGDKNIPLGVPRMDQSQEKPRFMTLLGTPIDDQVQNSVGMLVARLHFDRVAEMLREAEIRYGDTVYVMEKSGRVIIRGDRALVELADQLGQSLRKQLADGGMVHYWHDDGTEVVGSLVNVRGIDWRVVAERSSAVAYAEVRTLQQWTALLVLGLVAFIGFIGYLMARGLTAPLSRLTSGAEQVASGDLDVEIEVRGEDEIAYLTRVFNEMVEQITAAQEQLVDQNRKLEILSSTDPLTGLYNRQHLTRKISDLLASSTRSKSNFALLMLDLDHFKRLNDDHGHLAGDEALRGVADHLRHTLREDDYAARFGGEEFLVLLPGLDAELAMKTAERIREAVSRNTLSFESGKVEMTLSAGIAVFPQSGRTMDALIQSADAALYVAKEGGRNRCEMGHEPGLRVIG